MSQINEITMPIKSSNPIDFKAKKEALEKLARVDTDVLEKLAEISTSSKAINTFRDKWNFIKTIFV